MNTTGRRGIDHAPPAAEGALKQHPPGCAGAVFGSPGRHSVPGIVSSYSGLKMTARRAGHFDRALIRRLGTMPVGRRRPNSHQVRHPGLIRTSASNDSTPPLRMQRHHCAIAPVTYDFTDLGIAEIVTCWHNLPGARTRTPCLLSGHLFQGTGPSPSLSPPRVAGAVPPTRVHGSPVPGPLSKTAANPNGSATRSHRS